MFVITANNNKKKEEKHSKQNLIKKNLIMNAKKTTKTVHNRALLNPR